ncbi:unnamed protein product [Prorocentrum cordatum]|uniref:DNA-directed DNA polymerase n=1 Tax=Prorocentrum cordatum TaxID=2364126 RepID=A0ABN9V969_9DINO|nr:unnamed protein product [Polarella glacialis]
MLPPGGGEAPGGALPAGVSKSVSRQPPCETALPPQAGDEVELHYVAKASVGGSWDLYFPHAVGTVFLDLLGSWEIGPGGGAAVDRTASESDMSNCWLGSTTSSQRLGTLVGKLGKIDAGGPLDQQPTRPTLGPSPSAAPLARAAAAAAPPAGSAAPLGAQAALPSRDLGGAPGGLPPEGAAPAGSRAQPAGATAPVAAPAAGAAAAAPAAPAGSAASAGAPQGGVAEVVAAAGSVPGAAAPQRLAELGLEGPVVDAYAERGITSLYEWQAQCLAVPGVTDGRNLVYCAPTSGGKTLVSEVLMLRRVFSLKKKAIFVLPYVSIVSEKTQYLQSICRHTGASVKGFYGGSPEGIRESFDVAVCTIEKANALVNHLITEGKLADSVGTFVVDELHLVGDGSRGYLLEVTLSKVLYLAKDAQVVGMSATLPNVADIASWIGGALYQTSYRPVPLREYILSNGQLLNPDGSLEREVRMDGAPAGPSEPGSCDLLAAVWEVLRDGHSVLIFCSSKVKCEKAAELLAERLPVLPAEQARAAARGAMVGEMQQQTFGFDERLARTLPRGVAFHHGGLTTHERGIIERGYRQGDVGVICATSTLAAGVNLPARRVIFQTPFMGNKLLDATQYRQMAGRAGRAGQGTFGEAVLIAPGRMRQQVQELVAQALPRVASCLRSESRGLQRLLLEVLCVTGLGAGEELVRFCRSTLLATQKAAEGRQLTGDLAKDYPEIADAVQWLLRHDMVRLDERVQTYAATPIGQAVVASGLDPQQGHLLFQELDRARSCVSLDTDLHICYLVTPPDVGVTVDYEVFSRVLHCFSPPEQRAADRAGIRLDLVDRARFQGRMPAALLGSVDGFRLARFYSSLVLWAILHETPAPLLLRRFALGRGSLQQLQQAAASYVHVVAVFCNRLKWFSMESLILSFQKRLTFGARTELVPLMQIEGMDCSVARALYEHGFTTPVAIAGARPAEVLKVLRTTLPHDRPAASLPEGNAERLIEAARSSAKETVKDKQRAAREARKALKERASSATQPAKRARQASSAGAPAAARDTPPGQTAPAPAALDPSWGVAGQRAASAHAPSGPARCVPSASMAQGSSGQQGAASGIGTGHTSSGPAASPHTLPGQPQGGTGQREAQSGDRREHVSCRSLAPSHGMLSVPHGGIGCRAGDSDSSSGRAASMPMGPAQLLPGLSLERNGQQAPDGGSVIGRVASGPLTPAQQVSSMPQWSNGQRRADSDVASGLPSTVGASRMRASVALGTHPEAAPRTTGVVAAPCAAVQALPVGAAPHGAALRAQAAPWGLAPVPEEHVAEEPPSEVQQAQALCAIPPAMQPEGPAASPRPRGAVEGRDDYGAPSSPSPAQLSEGLRRIGRGSLTPRDLEAVSQQSASPGVSQRGGQHAGSARGPLSQRPSDGVYTSGEESRRAEHSPRSASESRAACAGAAAAAEAALLRSPFVISDDGQVPPCPMLQVLDPAVVAEWGPILQDRLAACAFLGATCAAGTGQTEVLCLALGPQEAVCILLPEPGRSPSAPLMTTLRCWFGDQRHLCVSPDAKDLVGALLRHGVDARCALAEPRVAWWLLDPDDKQHTSTQEIARQLGARLREQPAAERRQVAPLVGEGARGLDPILRTQILACWPECFLALPLMALLLGRLAGQQLLDSFWQVEMPFAAVLAWMEHFGIACDARDPLNTRSHVLYRLAALEQRVGELVGRSVQLSSSEDVGRALFEDLEVPLPPGARFKRKANGRVAFRSSAELLQRLPPHPVVDHVLEHRRLAHAVRRIESLAHAGGPPRPEPPCAECCRCGPAAAPERPQEEAAPPAPPAPPPLPRVRCELVQTATATGRLATGPGSVPLLCLENPFEMREVARPSLQEELSAGLRPEPGCRVFVASAASAPPRPRLLREGALHAVDERSCADVFPGGAAPLADYWVAHGWSHYAEAATARAVRQVLVRHGPHGASVLTYPADQVWRLAAPVRLEDGAAPPLLVNPRRLLVAGAGRVLVSLDYSQLEVRIMAHFSQDERFVEILHGDGDVFRHVAAGWLRKPEAAVTAEERSGAKRICYGLVYGIGAPRLAAELRISRAQAQEFQASFMREYAGVAAWVLRCSHRARQCGYVETLHGRQRFLPGLASRAAAERAHAERQAVNTSCQASAADLMKTAMLGIHRQLLELRTHEGGQCRMAARMLLQIHDELLIEVEEAFLDRVRELAVREMIGAGEGLLRVPLQVKWRVGRTWGDLLAP